MNIRLWQVLRETVSECIADSAPRLSAALAFYTILSTAPLVVIATAIVGYVFGDDAAQGQVTEQLKGLLGTAAADVVQTAIANADKPASGLLATIIGVVSLLFGASGVFGELQSTLNTVWNVRPKAGRGFLGIVSDRFLSFGMVVVIGFLLLVTLFISTALTAFGGYLEGVLPGLPIIMRLLNLAASVVIVTLLFALIFKFLPDVEIEWKDVWVGAFVTSLLFTLGKYLIGLYLAKASVGSAFGAAGSLVAFVVWVYYSGLILLFGAELTQVLAKHLGRSIRPSKNAESISRTDESPK